MTPKERILATLNREPVDRLPVDLWHTPEIGAALRAHCGVATDMEVYRVLGLDKIVWVFMDYLTREGDSAGSQVGAEAAGARTMWGVPLRGIEAGAAHYDEFGEAPMKDIEDPAAVEEYPWWPEVDRFDYDQALQAAREASREYAVIGPWVSFFEIYCQLRGLEQSMMDLALNPELVEGILDRVEAIQTEMMTRFLRQAGETVDMVFVSDDIAGQTGLLMSPDMWRRHLQPRLKRWCALIHAHGKRVFYHTDGAAGPLIPSLIECGIDVLNPIQHVCRGMEPAGLKAAFGDRVIFHGGVDNQHVLPFGSPAEVRAEVRMLLDSLGAGREGFICCSCHNVQAGTPVENVLAMIDAMQKA
jgi:uroporphyrinogen decarboxylase